MNAHRIVITSVLLLVLGVVPLAALESVDHNHTSFNQVLQTYVINGQVDYEALAKAPKLLRSYIDEMGSLSDDDLSSFTLNQKMVYWINLYNALTLDAVLQNHPIQGQNSAFATNSPRQVEGFWTAIKWKTPAGRTTLNQIEFDQLRRFGKIDWLFAISNATASGGYLLSEAYTDRQLVNQLEQATTLWVRNPNNMKFDKKKQVLYVSEYLRSHRNNLKRKYYKRGDLLGRSQEENIMGHIFLTYSDDEEAKAIIRNGIFSLTYLPYDWALNAR